MRCTAFPFGLMLAMEKLTSVQDVHSLSLLQPSYLVFAALQPDAMETTSRE